MTHPTRWPRWPFPRSASALPAAVVRALGAVCLGLAIVLASCGGEVDPTPTPAGTTPPTATPGTVATPTPAATPAPTATQSPPPTATPAGTPIAAPTPEREFAGLTNWLNSEPLTITELVARNRVVLVDFWTYTCVNCIRTLPRLRQWHERYAAHGLTIVGVHTPEFDFEREPDNVAEAVGRLGIAYPVAQDNDYLTWQAFYNCCWPGKYLIGVDGALVYRHVGEGAYQSTEGAIREALEAAGYDLSGVPPGEEPDPDFDPVATAQTRELYGGYARNLAPFGVYAGQEAYYGAPDEVRDYVDTGERLDGMWYLQGLWRNEREAIVHARTTEDLSDYFAFTFLARTVHIVLRPQRAEPFDMIVELDGRPLRPDEAGPDVTFDEAGRSVVRVEEPRLYRVVDLPQWGEHELRVRSDSDDFAIFAVTFGSYAEEP